MTSVFVGLNGFPLIFLIIVLLSVLWLRIKMNSFHLSFLVWSIRFLVSDLNCLKGKK